MTDRGAKSGTSSVEFLSSSSQQLWGETSFKGLVKCFVKLVESDFDGDQFAFLTAEGGPRKSTLRKINSGAIRVPGVRPFDSDALDALKAALEALDLSAPEFRDGHASLAHGSFQFQIVVVEAPAALSADTPSPDGPPPATPSADTTQSEAWGVIAWREGPLAARNWAATHAGDGERLSVMAMGLHLDFLARQLQSECRWFRKLDTTQALLYRDELTGLFNYRYLDVAIDGELRRASRFRTSFCLLFIDLDNFKPINDAHGHLSGSSVLKQVSDCLRRVVREVDSIIRYGGDEYVVVLLGATSAAGVLAAERIRREIANTRFITEDRAEVSLTASIGIACCPEHGEDKETLLRLADETMYRSKRGGKNRVMMVGSDQPVSPADFQPGTGSGETR